MSSDGWKCGPGRQSLSGLLWLLKCCITCFLKILVWRSGKFIIHVANGTFVSRVSTGEWSVQPAALMENGFCTSIKMKLILKENWKLIQGKHNLRSHSNCLFQDFLKLREVHAWVTSDPCERWFFPSFTTVNQVYHRFGFALTDPSISSADENSESESDSDDRFKGKGPALSNF